MNGILFAAMAMMSLSWGTLATIAQDNGDGDGDAPKPQVMIMGVFHFQDAGLDTVKAKHMDVMAEAPQAYLEELTAREFGGAQSSATWWHRGSGAHGDHEGIGAG